MQAFSLPIGTDNFYKLAILNPNTHKKMYFIDKTEMIHDFFTSDDAVTLIIRPRRWGKSLNLSMLQHFLAPEVNGNLTARLFDNLAISKIDNGAFLKEHQGQYPVLCINLKDVRGNTYADAVYAIGLAMMNACKQHYDILATSQNLNIHDKTLLEKLVINACSEYELSNAIQSLTELIKKHYGKNAYVLIDEYDSPMNNAYGKTHFEPFSEFIKTLLSSGLKSNPYLEKGLLTGVLRVSKNNMLSGLNNLEVYTLLNDITYSKYFGFTEAEVSCLLSDMNLTQDKEIVSQWYNGYHTKDGLTLYNPWSLIEYAKHKEPANYWVQTGNVDNFIKEAMIRSSDEVKEQLLTLLTDGSIDGVEINTEIHYEDISENGSSNALWSLLFFTGYLSLDKMENQKYTLKIPNKEVKTTYTSIFKNWWEKLGTQRYHHLCAHLVNGDIESFTEDVRDYLITVPSTYDLTRESNYHTFMLGLICGIQDTHFIFSNRESGFGRPDVLIIPRNKENPLAIILEFKHAKPGDNIDDLMQKALDQMDIKSYDTGAKDFHHITKILKASLVFMGKDVQSRSIRIKA